VAGSIGYANTADAVGTFTRTLTASTAPIPGGGASASHLIAYAQIQDNGTTGSPTPVYADPLNAAGTKANCSTARGAWSGTLPDGRTPGQSWSAVSANNPSVGGGFYPICAATYVEGWDSYSVAGLRSFYTSQANSGSTAKDYIQYLVDAGSYTLGGGQDLLAPTGSTLPYYSALPSDVLTSAQNAANTVN
jgi:hypothetical protein